MKKIIIFIFINLLFLIIIKKIIINNKNYKKIIFNYKNIIYTLIYILIIKNYIYEIFYIPSLSMWPKLKIGNYIIINKLYYNIKNPINNKTIYKINKINYGDIVVFKYPKNNKIYYIKRIIGLPKDIIIYNEKNKYIKIYKKNINKKNKYILNNIIKYSKKNKIKYILKINYNNKKQKIIKIKNINLIKNKINYNLFFLIEKYEYIKNKKYKIILIPNFYLIKKKNINKIWKVPKKMYFVIGDFRDNSNDSRSWGFLKENLIIGKLEYIL